MLKDGELPMVGTQARMLGPAPKDITVDEAGNVHPGQEGISVAPALRELPPHLIPKQLRHLVVDAVGSNSSVIWRHGEGPFVDRASVAPHLELRVDSAVHGVVAPGHCMSFHEYAEKIASTRADWVQDEK